MPLFNPDGVLARARRGLPGGFTIIELLVSIAILLIISLSVVTDLNRSRYQEELNGSARATVGLLRDIQARALAASDVRTCTAAGGTVGLCELSTVVCTGTCTTSTAAYAYGVEFARNATGVFAFADAEPTLNNRRPDGVGELVKLQPFLQGVSGLEHVTISRVDDQLFPNIVKGWVTFERQSGALRTDACDTPAPVTPACVIPGVEPTTMTITLTHARTLRTRVIRINGVTGKISID